MRSFYRQGPPMGRSMSFGPGRISPFIKWMLMANGAMYLLQVLGGRAVADLLVLSTSEFFPSFPNNVYQIFTYMFLHGSLMHLFFNMFILWMFGTEIEHTWGTRRFARLYLIAGLAGGLLSLIAYGLFSAHPAMILGASGAVYGILVAYWVMYPERTLYLYFVFPVKVRWAIPGLLIIGFLFGGSGVAHMAHLGGALTGLIYMKADWRWTSFFGRWRKTKHQRQESKLAKRRQQAEDIMKRVDSILDKINEVGIENISKADREFLEEASSELSEQKDKQGRSH